MAERGDGNRLQGTTQLTNLWSRSGFLSVEQYLIATDGLGWTPEDYERWLGDLLEHGLLQPRRYQRRRSLTAGPTSRNDRHSLDRRLRCPAAGNCL